MKVEEVANTEDKNVEKNNEEEEKYEKKDEKKNEGGRGRDG